MKPAIRGVLAAAASLVLAAAAVPAAAANLLTNGSFESGTTNDNADHTTVLATGSTAMTGWTVVDNEIAWIGAGNPFNGAAAPDGNRFLDLTSYGSSLGGVQQSIATVPGQQYQVTFALGGSNAYAASSTLSVDIGGGPSTQFTITPTTTNDWAYHSTTFTAAGALTSITLRGYAATGSYIGLDDVSVVAAVPEPAEWAMLVAGLATIGVVTRRRAS